MTSFYIATPTTRDFNAAHVNCLLQMHKGDSCALWDVVEGQAIDKARNALVERFLKHPARPEFMLMMDSDATFHPDAVMRLMDRNLPMVSAVIYLRRFATVPPLGIFAKKDVEGHAIYSFQQAIDRIIERVKVEDVQQDIENEIVFPKHENDLMEIDACGGHFMLIRRDVLEKIKPPWFYSFSFNAGEDFYFCQQVKKAGFKIYADLSVHTGHIAGPGITIGLREFLILYNQTDLIKREKAVQWHV